MTRQHDHHLARDKGVTTEQLLAAGYAQDPDAILRQGELRKRQCHNCELWFDEVFAVCVDTELCAGCRTRYATGRKR
jgi:hypothetical protein